MNKFTVLKNNYKKYNNNNNGIEKEKQNRYRNSSDSNNNEGCNNGSLKDEPLTEYEQEYVKVHEQKVYHNEHVEALIDYYTIMNFFRNNNPDNNEVQVVKIIEEMIL